MAKLLQTSFFLLLATLVATAAAQQNSSFIQSQQWAPKLPKPKVSHLRFYWHDIVTGRDPTSVQIADAPSTNASATGFGTVMMIDNPLTLGPERSSKLVGRAQGFYASASKEELGLLMTMNLAFNEGKYNGSTITVLGKNSALMAVREMAVVGGTGMFRLARGHCEARTHWFDNTTGDATVLYNVFVRHY